MKLSIKRILATTLALCIFTGCTSVPGASSSSPATSPDVPATSASSQANKKPYAGTVVTINLNTPSDSVRDAYDKWVANLQKHILDQTGIELKVEMVSWGDYLNKHLTSIASNDGPDIIQMGSSVPPVIAAANGLLDLSPYMDSHFGGKSVYYDVGMYYCTWDDKTISIPWGGGGREMYYNKKLYDAAGLKYPELGWAMAQFESDAAALTKHMGQPAFSAPGAANDITYHFWSQLVTEGGSIFDSTMTKASFNGPEGVKAVKNLVDMYTKGYMPAAFAESTVDDTLPMFINQDVALAYGNASWWQDVKANMGDEFGTVPLPQGAANIPNGIVTMSSFGVMRYSKQPEAAIEVMGILCSPEEIVNATAIMGWIPFRSDLESDPAYDANPEAETFFYVAKNSKSFVPQHQAISKILSTSTKTLNSLYGELVTGKSITEEYIKEKLDILAVEVDSILNS